MPEYDKERLTRITAADTDSKRYKEALTSLEHYKRERYGLPIDEVVLEGEPIAPLPLTDMFASKLNRESNGQTPLTTSSLNAQDSRLALQIFGGREKKRSDKKAA